MLPVKSFRPCHCASTDRSGRVRLASLKANGSQCTGRLQRLSAAARPLETCQQHDVLEIAASTGSKEYVEIIQGWDAEKQSCQILWKGQLLQLALKAGPQCGSFELSPLGGYPPADGLVAQNFPQLAPVLPSMYSHAGPSLPEVASAAVVDSLSSLLQEVDADAAFWRDGTAPGDPIKTDLQQALFAAGELAAFLAGQRGIVLVQLWNGWDPSKGQPLYNPCAITMLERVLAAPGVGCCSSAAPGGVGLTGIVYADREPFASWAQHLASFGCQANAVAGSSYYKLLIGLLLGYKLENVLGYVAASGEAVTKELQQQVAQDIKRLSKVKPKLPWSANDENIKKAKPAKRAAGKPSGFGSKR